MKSSLTKQQETHRDKDQIGRTDMFSIISHRSIISSFIAILIN